MPKGEQVNEGRIQDERGEALFGLKIVWKDFQSGRQGLPISKPEELFFFSEKERNRVYNSYKDNKNILSIRKFKKNPSRKAR